MNDRNQERATRETYNKKKRKGTRETSKHVNTRKLHNRTWPEVNETKKKRSMMEIKEKADRGK